MTRNKYNEGWVREEEREMKINREIESRRGKDRNTDRDREIKAER